METTTVRMTLTNKTVLHGIARKMSFIVRMDTVSAACGTVMETMTVEITVTSSAIRGSALIKSSAALMEAASQNTGTVMETRTAKMEPMKRIAHLM